MFTIACAIDFTLAAWRSFSGPASFNVRSASAAATSAARARNSDKTPVAARTACSRTNAASSTSMIASAFSASPARAVRVAAAT